MDCLTPDAGLVRPALDVLAKIPLQYPGSNRLIEERIGESLIGDVRTTSVRCFADFGLYILIGRAAAFFLVGRD